MFPTARGLTTALTDEDLNIVVKGGAVAVAMLYAERQEAHPEALRMTLCPRCYNTWIDPDRDSCVDCEPCTPEPTGEF